VSEFYSQVSPRVFSLNTLLRPQLILSEIASLLASVALAVAILCVGTVCCVVAHSNRATTQPAVASSHSGLAGLAARMDDGLEKTITNRVAGTHSWWQRDRSTVALLVVLACLCMLARWGLRHFSESALADHVESETQRLRQHLHRKSIRLEPADVTGEQAALTDRLFRQSTSLLQTASLNRGRLLFSTAPDVAAVCVTALFVHWRVGLETLVPVVVCWFGMRAESQRNEATALLLSEQVERGLSRLAEGLKKTRLVTGYAMEELEQQRFEHNLTQYRSRCRNLRRQRETGRWVCRLIALTCVVIPGYLVTRHLLPPGDLEPGAAVVILVCAVILYRSLTSLQKAPGLESEASVRSEEIAGYIARVPSVGQVSGARFFEPMSRSLLFDQICLRTPQNSQLLLNLDLKINFGDRIALLSLNPAAAWALASMIPRFVDPDSGQVLLDGNDIRGATLESIRAECIFVGGADPVFNASVMDNISCGHKDITRQQVLEAAKVVHAGHFIRGLAKSYDTIVGEHGVSLDPGQVFRLSLARAIVRNPAILIIEEPTVAMDSETKALIDDAYQRICAGRTILFIPTRLSTVKRCSRVVMIHDGKIAADASHDKLVRGSDLYRHWEYQHFNAFRDDA
jgi:ATP-binding cassette, subfamily B, bacterial